MPAIISIAWDDWNVETLEQVVSISLSVPDDVPGWLRGFQLWLEQRPRLYETDANGHLSQLTYLAYQEWAFAEYIGAVGYPELVGSQAATSLFMGEQYCRFLSEINLGAAIRLGVRCARLGRSSMTLEYAFCRQDGVLAAVGSNTQILVEVASRRSAPLPPELRAAIERHEERT